MLPGIINTAMQTTHVRFITLLYIQNHILVDLIKYWHTIFITICTCWSTLSSAEAFRLVTWALKPLPNNVFKMVDLHINSCKI